MQEIGHKLNWNMICRYQRLSKSFMRKNSGRINWETVFQYQNLSESFIEEFSYLLDCKKISQYQTLTGNSLSDNWIRSWYQWMDISTNEAFKEDTVLKNCQITFNC